MNIIKVFDNDDPQDFHCRTRVVPSQPAGVPPGKVYVGSDLGWIDYTGEKPRAGDLVTITGQQVQRVASSGAATRPMRAPTFTEDCRCKCPSKNGTIIWANPIETGPYLIVMDQDGNFLQTINPPQLFRIAGVAVDPVAPHHLYVLDDRTRLNNFLTDASPNKQIAGVSTYALHRFVNSGASYVWNSVVEMTDPGLPATPFFISELNWVDGQAGTGGLTDPPATYPTNCLSVINGLLYITMSMRPARYLTWNGASFTTHNLTLNGNPYNFGLRGMVLSGLDKPAKSTSKFVLAWAGFGGFSGDGCDAYSVLEFDTSDRILRVLSNVSALKSPIALMLVCNRVFVLNSNYYGRTEDGSSGSLDGSFIQVGTGP